LAFLLLILPSAPVTSQTFPPLTGRVVDAANILPPADEAALTAKLEAIEQASTRQLVVATIPDLQGRDIADYGYRLLRNWGIGQKDADNGAILIVAPGERRVRIEVGYGLEPILTDAVSSLIIQNRMTPAFKAGDYPGGIVAGVDAIAEQLRAPPEVAERQAREAQARQAQTEGPRRRGGGSIFPLLFWGAVLLFVVLPMLRGAGGGGRNGRRYRRRGGLDSASSILLWEVANAAMRSGRGGGGFGGGGFGGGGFGGGGGGFSGGGGSGGGGGASGSW